MLDPAVLGGAFGGERPPGYCNISTGAQDNQNGYCQTVTGVAVFGGNECKPQLQAHASATKFTTIPEGCCVAGLTEQMAHFAIAAVARSAAAASRATATSVPFVAYVRAEMAGSASGSIFVSFPNATVSTSFNSATPTFLDTLRGEVTFGEPQFSGDGRALYAGSITLVYSLSAGVCNWDEAMSQTTEAIIDPFIEVDPSWPDAANWVIKKETQPGSGVYVEIRRDSATVQFTDISPAGQPVTTGIGGIAWGDYDGDGDLDLYATSMEAALPSKLYRNDGGLLTDVTTPELAMLPSYGRDASWADVDSDGDLDLLVTRGVVPAKNLVMRNEGGTGFVRDSTCGLALADVGRGIGWADYDRDGDLDVFIANCSRGRLLRNDGGWVFTDVTPPALAASLCIQAGLWGDYDNDGDPDLAVLVRQNAVAPPMLFRNNNGSFTDVTSTSGLPAMNRIDLVGGTWTDFDDDGWLDLYVSMNGANRLFRNRHDGTFADSTEAWTGYAGTGAGVAWGDLDLDGDLDCYLAKTDLPSRIAVRFDQHFGTSMYHVGGPVEVPGGERSVGWADIDDDGDLDLFVGRNGQCLLLRNDQALGNHWLQVDLRGIQSNRNGVGSRIRVVAGGHSHHRQVLSNTGWWNGNPLRQTFGLGEDPVVDTLEVRWPSGVVTTLPGPFSGDRRVTVSENGTVTGLESGPVAESRPRLLASAPNPFASVAVLRFQLPAPMKVQFTIYDLAGRRVRDLSSDAEMPAGVGEFVWDGRDDEGRALRTGVYFCRMRAGGFESGPGSVFKMTKRD